MPQDLKDFQPLYNYWIRTKCHHRIIWYSAVTNCVSKIVRDYLWFGGLTGVSFYLYTEKEKLGIPNLVSASWNRSSVLVVLMLKARQLIYTGYANSEKFYSKGLSLNWIDVPISTARTRYPIGTFPY
jgi:hypothetical protein